MNSIGFIISSSNLKDKWQIRLKMNSIKLKPNNSQILFKRVKKEVHRNIELHQTLCTYSNAYLQCMVNTYSNAYRQNKKLQQDVKINSIKVHSNKEQKDIERYPNSTKCLIIRRWSTLPPCSADLPPFSKITEYVILNLDWVEHQNGKSAHWH